MIKEIRKCRLCGREFVVKTSLGDDGGAFGVSVETQKYGNITGCACDNAERLFLVEKMVQVDAAVKAFRANCSEWDEMCDEDKIEKLRMKLPPGEFE